MHCNMPKKPIEPGFIGSNFMENFKTVLGFDSTRSPDAAGLDFDAYLSLTWLWNVSVHDFKRSISL